ncbi:MULTISPECIES: hypothetical protein [Gibbsiella]|uniref:hypothetical protein n=1 Tax=Gibbsiella TaxID=929812 RepID=UPI00242C36D8|nr:hypothetical protein [Gibbsiella quercinecans]
MPRNGTSVLLINNQRNTCTNIKQSVGQTHTDKKDFFINLINNAFILLRERKNTHGEAERKTTKQLWCKFRAQRTTMKLKEQRGNHTKPSHFTDSWLTATFICGDEAPCRRRLIAEICLATRRQVERRTGAAEPEYIQTNIIRPHTQQGSEHEEQHGNRTKMGHVTIRPIYC